MITLFGKPGEGSLTRRGFLRVGGMAAGGLSLAQLMSIEARAQAGRTQKAIINIYMPGGPSHIDMFDPKPGAPTDIRGDFDAIGTNVAGIQISELFPRMARMMDKFAIIRSVVGSEGLHDLYQCMTGRTRKEMKPAGGSWPSMGAWVSRLQGEARVGVPPNVHMMYPTGNRTWGEPGDAGFVGQSHAPMACVSKDPLARPEGLTLNGITLDRLQDRDGLRKAVDTFRREADATGAMQGLDTFGRQALDILGTSKLSDALDLSKEDPKTLARYGTNDVAYERDGAPFMIRNFLVARRLVEAGARVVSLNYGRWDWHGGDGMNTPMSRKWCPELDRGLCALVEDLHQRGLDKDVSVVLWGEFGRTPKINKDNSRDHWPQVTFAVLAGGGMRTGQVIGATNRLGEYATERPVTFADVFATLYKNLGIDVHAATVNDAQGRPQYLLDTAAEAIRELV